MPIIRAVRRWEVTDSELFELRLTQLLAEESEVIENIEKKVKDIGEME